MSSSLKVSVATPIQPIPYGCGFYQTEEEALYIQLGGIFGSQRFFSFIDSSISRFDLDRQGRLLFFELACPKRRWQVVEEIMMPEVVEPADIRWLNFRKKIKEPELFTDKNHSKLLIKLSDEEPVNNYYLSHSIILQVSKNNLATRILINEIIDDTAGKKIAEFRRQLSGKKSAAEPDRSIGSNLPASS